MSDEPDFSNLSVEEKITHSVWKARLQGYTALIDQFENSRNDSDPCFNVLNSRPDTLKSLVLDSNVVAQESAVLLVAKYLEYGCPSSNINRVKTSGLVGALCEKGLASNRAGTKAKSVEALLLLAEMSESAEWIVEQIVPHLENRLPKLVAGCVNALYQLVLNYGCALVPPKLIIPSLAKLFAHADRNVRAETTKLTVELYVWLRAGLTQQLFPNLKPVQQRDLTAEFAKVEEKKPEQVRLTRSQKNAPEPDVHMEDAPVGGTEFDPFEAMEPVDVLAKMPGDLYARASSDKWKDRVEVLEEVQQVLSQAPKLALGDYADLVRLFAKCFKDANIQVVQLAANGVESMAKGLKEAFSKYRPLVLAPIIERSKEKKPAVADALAAALDSIFASSSLSDILDDTLAGMRHKTPQVKIAATNFLRRCLASTTVAPKITQIDSIMQVGVKLLTDSQEPIRQAATEMVGTLMKITGERELKAMLEKVDENRLSKVRAVYEKATVNVAGVPKSQRPDSAPETMPPSRLGATPVLKKATPSQSIPSKRLATSPAKRADTTARSAAKLPTKTPAKSPTRTATKIPAGFAGRSLSPPSNGNAPRPAEPTIPPQFLEEMRALKEENRRLTEENESASQAQTTLVDDVRRLKSENAVLLEQVDSLQRNNTNGNLTVKQRDTQIMRLMSDLESAKMTITSLEQTIDMMKLSSSTHTQSSQPYMGAFASPFASPSRVSSSRITSADLSSRVDRLSIEKGALPGGHETHSRRYSEDPDAGVTRATGGRPSGPATNVATGEENWKQAAAVTAQLKARIEEMKQRNRLGTR